jgi:signal transduction histidine kinase
MAVSLGVPVLKSAGSGLGLTMVKSLVEKTGGIIGAESTTGKGSAFYFTLPFPAKT